MSILDQKSFYPFLKQCRFPQTVPKKTADEQKTNLRYVVSLSGGLDSIVLLHLMYTLKERLYRDNYHLSASYVNHNLSPKSYDWELFCQSVCTDYNIPIQVLSVNAHPQKRQSPEEAARNARYNALKQSLSSSDCLLTAHHQSDQSETMLLQLFRGSGPKGLSAMPINKAFPPATLSRPLLSFSQEQIKNYAILHKLQWVEDESNLQQIFKRNFLRHSILPKLKQQWPGIDKTLFRASQIQAETVSILNEVAEQDLVYCELSTELEKKQNPWFFEPMLNYQKLQTLSIARIKSCLQYWLKKHHLIALNSALLNEFIIEFINQPASVTSQIVLNNHLAGNDLNTVYSLRYFQQRIFLCSNLINQQEIKHINPQILIKFRQGGEKYKKNSHSSHYSLKNWFQENSVPPWLRDNVPLFYLADELIQIGYSLVNQDYKTDNNKYLTDFTLAGIK